MDLLDDDLLPMMPDDEMQADDLDADNDHNSTSHDLYPRNTTTLSGLLVKIPRHVHKGPPERAQRTCRPILQRKRKRVHETLPASAPEPYLDSQESQDEKAAITRDFANDVKLFQEPPPTPIASPFPVEPLKRRSAATLGLETALRHVPFSLRLVTVGALSGKGNTKLPRPGPMRFMVAKGGLEINGGQTHSRRFVPEAEKLPDDLEPESSADEKEDEELLVPKIEPGLGHEEILDMQGGTLGSERRTSEEMQSLLPPSFKRPRGRPRKHPLPISGESINKLGKGRSKTGCITCRKRKKKCDEAKPKCKCSTAIIQN